MDQKGQYLAEIDQNCIFQAKFGFGEGAKVLVLTYQKTSGLFLRFAEKQKTGRKSVFFFQKKERNPLKD